MPRLYIAQLKCPNNHCIVAAAGEYGDIETADKEMHNYLAATFDMYCRTGKLNRRCGICHSTDLYIHVTETRFETLQEGEAQLRELEAAQELAREFLKHGRN